MELGNITENKSTPQGIKDILTHVQVENLNKVTKGCQPYSLTATMF